MTTCSKVPTMREAFDNRDFFWFMSPEQIEQQKRGKDQVTSVRIDGHTKDAIRQLLNYLEDEERDYMER